MQIYLVLVFVPDLLRQTPRSIMVKLNLMGDKQIIIIVDRGEHEKQIARS